MNEMAVKCLVVSNFTIRNLAGVLANNEDAPIVRTEIAPFDQVVQVLADESLDCWKNDPDLAVIWTQPDTLIPSFSRVLDHEDVAVENVLAEVDQFSELVLGITDRVRSVLVPTWATPPYSKVFGLLDMKTGVGATNTLMRMNLRLCENLEKASNVHVLNSQRWMNSGVPMPFNPRLWYMARIPFENAVFVEAAKDIKSALNGIRGNARKLIVVDLDNTLWGGVVGEEGWERLRLGGHDQVGEAFVDFQRSLKSLTNRGLILGIVSKNDESVALDAIENHPEMALRLVDFAGWRVNWQDKAKNVVDLVSELNLGLQSVVFIDDHPVERARVREALPEVLVPDWPSDPMLYKTALLSLTCFNAPSTSSEDAKRTEMYVSDRQRMSLRREVGSAQDWLSTLDTKIKAEDLNEINLQRTTQLLNKTNQMNLTTRRMSEPELSDWTRHPDHHLWTFRVSDKFGDSGLTGIISLTVEDEAGRIVDFVLSCRVLGRNVEETMLLTVVQQARRLGLEKIVATYVPTSKNRPCLDFWKRSKFATGKNSRSFRWNVRDDYPTPKHVQID